MDALEWGISEIVQATLVVFTLLTIGGAILFVGNPDRLVAKAAAHEMSYIATLITNNDVVVEVSYDNLKIEEKGNNQITASYDGVGYDKSYFGEEVQIKSGGENLFIISS